ncbi:flagella synthesis protein FlgN [Methylophaga sp.]|uniref:flagella synthesis protein FlgN n=1 Tax=Methylophaga sp. TaxID=2024840 RepID=UPI00271896E1|nr:flagellar protein FlgN [Methylophaga sp.]MDO8826816.1 flagellar protein FlgN [Methylophaga sp.]
MAMSPGQQLRSVLQSELNVAAQLAELLAAEREALAVSSIDSINDINNKKQPLIIKLEQHGRQRDALLTTSGFPTGKQGLEAFIDNQNEEDSVALNQLIKSLKIIAKNCQQTNQVNGGIVSINRQYLQRAISVLRGRDPESSAYGPGGEYTSAVVRQPLIGRV